MIDHYKQRYIVEAVTAQKRLKRELPPGVQHQRKKECRMASWAATVVFDPTF
jgi:hypothetical protein